MLFQRFSQASPKTYKQYGGSGLGLFISRELCELQGGQIGVSSPGVGRGTTFAFYVRARRCPPENEDFSASPVAIQHVWNTPVTGSTIVPQAAPSLSENISIVSKDGSKFTNSTKHKKPRRALHVLVVEVRLAINVPDQFTNKTHYRTI
jgi:hypothetical protein